MRVRYDDGKGNFQAEIGGWLKTIEDKRCLVEKFKQIYQGDLAGNLEEKYNNIKDARIAEKHVGFSILRVVSESA